MPAKVGQATLVPPIRLRRNAYVMPSGCSLVSPTRSPVLGSANAETSVLAHGVGLVPPLGSAVARLRHHALLVGGLGECRSHATSARAVVAIGVVARRGVLPGLAAGGQRVERVPHEVSNS